MISLAKLQRKNEPTKRQLTFFIPFRDFPSTNRAFPFAISHFCSNFAHKNKNNPIYNDKEDRVYFVQIKNKTANNINITQPRLTGEEKYSITSGLPLY